MLELLEQELKTYQEHKSDLVGKSKGKFVLIKGDQIIEVFENRFDAIRNGYERFGNVPFLVKQIRETEIPLTFTSNLFGN